MNAPSRRAVLALAVIAAPCLRSARAQPAAVEQPLEALHAALLAAMRAGKAAPFAQRFDAMAPAVDQAFDLETILRVSVGLSWNGMDPAAQARLLKAFRRFTIATYVANFDKSDGEQFTIVPGTRDSGNDRIVRTEIHSGSGDRIRLDYVMRETSGTWRAVDVLLDGSISRVAVQRSDFRKILGSGDADALITSLQRKVADLSDGALRS
jgi:phospholipid transport system substrate-binding protein